MNSRQFGITLTEKAAELARVAPARLQAALVLDCMRSIALKTPVDTGRARGNWQATIGSPGVPVLETSDRSGRAAIASAQAVASRLSSVPFSVAYLSNALPYIRVLEFGLYSPPGQGPRLDLRAFKLVTRRKKASDARLTAKGIARLSKRTRRAIKSAERLLQHRVTPQGYSTQAPAGMVGVTIEEMRARLGDRVYIRRALSAKQIGELPFGAGIDE